MNWLIICIVGILMIALIVFLINRNKKDMKDLVEELNKDYDSPRTETCGTDIDELTKNVH